jgi:hypothetical protein
MEGGGSAMTDGAPHPERFLASRLDLLFRTVHPQDRKPYTAAEVAKAINDAAGENAISAGSRQQRRGSYERQRRASAARTLASGPRISHPTAAAPARSRYWSGHAAYVRPAWI